MLPSIQSRRRGWLPTVGGFARTARFTKGPKDEACTMRYPGFGRFHCMGRCWAARRYLTSKERFRQGASHWDPASPSEPVPPRHRLAELQVRGDVVPIGGRQSSDLPCRTMAQRRADGRSWRQMRPRPLDFVYRLRHTVASSSVDIIRGAAVEARARVRDEPPARRRAVGRLELEAAGRASTLARAVVARRRATRAGAARTPALRRR